MIKLTAIFGLFLSAALGFGASGNPSAAANDMVWHSLGTNENDSMPLGNGDIALNVWTEQNGDIVLLAAKSDAWSENGQLLKPGCVRVRLTPNPFANQASFTQTLKLELGEIVLQTDKSMVRIWVDAHQPVIHLETRSDQPLQMTAASELWRTNAYHLDQPATGRAGFFEWGNNPDGLDFDADTVFPTHNDIISWYHFNSRSIYPLVFAKEHLESLLPKYPDPLLHRCFGLAMRGPGLLGVGNQRLQSASPTTSPRLDIYALTQQAASPEEWNAEMNQVIASARTNSLPMAFKQHEQWWSDFWDRSWINVGGTPDASRVSQGYAMQRYMTACAGRGAYPIKFNGSLFTVGHDLPAGVSSSADDHDPDFRAWGASYWNQNTRLIYWPLIASGDFDLLSPWFNMYVQALPLAKERTREYFHHNGGAFIETIYFWGLPNVNDFGWNNRGPETGSEWIRYHTQGGLEVLAQMLDRYDYSGDNAFARSNVVPMADAVITYYHEHYPRNGSGKLLLSPAQSIETYQQDAVNPTPDIAGLMNALPRLLALPSVLTTPEQRNV